ncbi:YciI family protein [Rhizobium wuzhouense]|uniref:Dehydrogenase n=1 Tax=Rhizobium wuzhouense TaxID=1986026 RepID=A0ABX5NUL1_9HYPH|nr:YciI family protein [Rhizobium wuzhouense]PYB76853.1 dehydrogenase [Rhizobium wuzhouense]
MRFVCFIHTDPQDIAEISDADHRRIVAEHFAFDEAITATGHHIVSEALEDPDRSVTIRRSAKGVTVSVGPFTEAREHIGGFYLLEAASLDEAIRIASRIPSLQHSSVEIRPVRTLVLDGE